MKKLFFAICFNICLFSVVHARITPISGHVDIKQEIVGDRTAAVKEVNREEFVEFLIERFSKSMKADANNINKSISHVESRLETDMKKEKEKNFFQKVFDTAIKKINKPADEKREDIFDESAAEEFNKNLIATVNNQYKQEEVTKQLNQWNKIGVPTISTILPIYNTTVEVPAIEHIPLLASNIEVLPNGMVKFEETVVVVANAQKLRHGLTKILPSKIIDEKGRVNNIDYTIIDVSINDTPINYSLAKNQDRVLLVPDKDYILAPGIYTYKFQYLADNALVSSNDAYKFYWSVGGNGWNLIIDRSITNLTIPDKNGLLNYSAIIGSNRGYYSNSVSYKQNPISISFEANIPIFIGNGMIIDVNIDKNTMLPTTMGQRFVRSFYNYGDIYISFIGLLFITIASIISWRYITGGRSRVNVSLSKTALMVRYMLYEKFDKKSIGGFLLDMCKKNIIDIQKNDGKIFIIKSTDMLRSLASYEKKALKSLFPSHETTFVVNKNNKLPWKRFIKYLDRGLKGEIFKFNFKLNIGYLLLNLAMLSFVIGAIASFKINSLYVLKIATAIMFVSFIGVLLWYVTDKKWLKYITRTLSVIVLSVCLIIYSNHYYVAFCTEIHIIVLILQNSNAYN